MQNTSNRVLTEEESSTKSQVVDSLSNNGTAVAAPTARMLPPGVNFPCAAMWGVYANNYGLATNVSNNVANTMMRYGDHVQQGYLPLYGQQDMLFELTPSPNKESFSNRGASVAMSEVIAPNENDVLMGRGGKNNQWHGNEKLRILARGRCKEYQKASKKGKSQISRELVDAVRKMNPPGRFLRKQAGGSSKWEDVGDDVAREKTSQVLRDAIHAVKCFSGDSVSSRSTLSPAVSSPAVGKGESKLVTNEKPTSFQHSVPPQQRMNLPSSTGSRSVPPILGFRSHDNVLSPAMRYPQPYLPRQNPAGPPRNNMFSLSAQSLPAQFAITPSSSSMNPPSTAKKRPRYQESPLVAGYHQHSLQPTPTMHQGFQYGNTPDVSCMFGSPPNPRRQGFEYSPSPQVASVRRRSAGYRVPDSSMELRNSERTFSSAGQAAAGEPPGETSDCWISDVPRFSPIPAMAHQPEQQTKQENLPSKGSPLHGPDFDPFNDELLSDSERGDGAISPFPYPKRDSI